MKISTKIIIYCLWIGFLIWLSIFGSPYFSDFISVIKRKFFGDHVSPSIDFAIAFIPWNVFISLLLWFPHLFMKQQRLEAAREIVAGAIFFFLALAINIFGVLIWCMYFPESIGAFSGEPGFSAMERYAINDGWTAFQFTTAWWLYLILTNAFCAVMAVSVSLMTKQGILKTLAS